MVPLSYPYDLYNENKLYFDGLAYLGKFISYNVGFVHTADVIKPYQLK